MDKKIYSVLSILTFSILVPFSSQATESKNGSTRNEIDVKVEKTATAVKITATGKSGYHCNTLYPWKLTVTGPENGKSTTYKKADAKTFSEEKVVFELPSKKGQKAKMKMSVCNEKQCIMHTQELSW